MRGRKVDLKAIADFLFEVGMLKRTPRSGFQFLGTGHETVAEHSLRAAVIGYVTGPAFRKSCHREGGSHVPVS